MFGDGKAGNQVPGSARPTRERSQSNLSTSSTSSFASAVSGNSGVSDNYSVTFSNEAHPKTQQSDSSNNLSTKNAAKPRSRSRSSSRGRKSSTESTGSATDDSRGSHGGAFQRMSKSRPRSLAPGPIYHILNNFKPFGRDRDSREPSRTEQITGSSLSAPGGFGHEPQQPSIGSSGAAAGGSLHSPHGSYVGNMRNIETPASDSEESLDERGRRPMRTQRHASDRSESPSLRRMKLFPSLATLVPSSNCSSDQATTSSITESARRVLSRRSRSSSRTKIDEVSPMDTHFYSMGNSADSARPSLSTSSGMLSLPNSQGAHRRRSSTNLRSQSALDGILSSLPSGPPSLFSSSKPSSDSTSFRSIFGISRAKESDICATNQGVTPTAASAAAAAAAAPEPEYIRHSELPSTAPSPPSSSLGSDDGSRSGRDTLESASRLTSRSQSGQQIRSVNRDRLCFLRVYRPDGTFGTIACPVDISAERLIQLAARKFFITEVEEYHLVALKPASVTILSPEAHPAKLIRDMLVHAGYHSTMDRINDVSRDDTSFLCRIVLANINEPLRPPLLTQGIRDLVLVDTDVTDAPSLACSDARHVETLDVSRSAFKGTSTVFPRLKHLKMTRMFLLDGSLSLLTPQLPCLMRNLTRLSLSGSGIVSLDGLNFAQAPQLRYLDLRGNQLTDLPQMILHLPFLEVLLCGTNALTHFEIWNPSLRKIDLSYNKFSRLLLRNEQASQMVNLKFLQLCANSLATLPESLHQLPVLQELDVRHNMIANPIEAMTPTLQRLVASYNNPRGMNQRDSSTASREVHDSKTESRELPHIRELKLEGLHTLELHESLNMANITSLDMRNTHMPYVHESLFKNAPNLQVLNLSNNSLTRLPASIRDLHYLEELYVCNNSLVDLPAALFELQELTILDAHANNLKVLPSHAMQSPKLRVLNVASNLISSLPPKSHITASSLVQLTVCDNQLTEDCFEVILQLSTLRILDLSHNFITEIPSRVFSQLPMLEELYLGGNRLSTLPHDDFLHASQLRVLQLCGNKLHTLPAELSKATNLEVLDVAANQLRYNVANWPYDWNWRWNTKLRVLNFSSNKRLEIRKSPQFIDDVTGVADLGDLCVLPNLVSLGLMDVTLTTNKVPFQTENCRVRSFGSDLQKFKVGIAESVGFRPLANNDLVVERFRNREDEFLVAMFDGHNEYPGGGNKISHLAQDCFAALLKREMQAKDTTTVDALRRAFLVTHREIGNTALLSSEEIAHTTLGHRNSIASKLTPVDWSAGTGATVLYFQGQKLYVATVGGARVVLSRSNGTHTVLSKPLPPVSAELDRIRSSGGVVDPKKSFVNNMAPYPRLIGCYIAGTAFSAAPSIYEYEFETLNVTDQIIVGSASIWEVIKHETAADIVRSTAQDPVLAAMKLRDFALSYGNRDRTMAMVIGRPWAQAPEAIGRQTSGGDVYEDELMAFRQRRQSLPEDSTLARLGTEVSPPFGDVTMVFTDIKNSTYLWESYPSVMRAAIKTHNSLMRRSIRLMDGYEVKNEGDAFIISFHTPVKALIWCLTVQQHLLTAEWPPELLEVDGCHPVYDDKENLIFRGLNVRMGIHCGRPVAEPDPVTKRMDYFGPMVNRASRISGIALGGQISVSSDFLNTLQYNLVAHKKVLEGVPLEEAYSYAQPSAAAALERSATVLDHTEYVVKELGELKLRGIENPEHIYNIYPISLASRQEYYDANDTGERQPHINTIPFTVGGAGRDSVTSSLQSPLSPRHPFEPTTQRDRMPSVSLGLPPFNSLPSSGLLSSSEMNSIPSSPLLAPDETVRRLSETGSVVSRESSRSYEYADSFRTKHSLHMNPPGGVATLEEPESEFPNHGDELQSLARRLDAICMATSFQVPLAAAQQILVQIDPPVPTDHKAVEIAPIVWLTRIENAIARLRELHDGGRI